MALRDFFSFVFGPVYEQRQSIEDPNVPLSDENIGKLIFGMEDSEAGVPVTLSTALGVAAYFRAISLRMNTIAGLEIDIFRKDKDGSKQERNNHDVYRVMNVEANPVMSGLDFRKLMRQHADNLGNGYARIRRHPTRGTLLDLWPLDDGKMIIHYNRKRMMVVYEHIDKSGKSTNYLADEIFHLKGYSSDGVIGRALVSLSEDIFGVAIASQKYLARLYGNNAMPSVLISTDKTLQQEDADEIEERWVKRYGKKNQGKPAVVGQGVKVTPLTMTNTDQELTAVIKHYVIEIGRITGVPPHLLFEMDRETYNNIEQNSIGWVRDGVRPMALDMETEIRRKLFMPSERVDHMAAHQLNDLMKGDSKSMAEYLNILWTSGAIDSGEIRKVFNLNVGENDNRRWIQQGFAPSDLSIKKMELEIEKIGKEIMQLSSNGQKVTA